jgi:hypothetical protein
MVSQTCKLHVGVCDLRSHVKLVGIFVVGNVFCGSLVLAIDLADLLGAAVTRWII